MAYVSLTPHLEAFIQGEVKSGRYSSPSEVIREAIRLLEEHKARRLERDAMAEELRQGIRVAREQMERGDVIDGAQAFREIRGEVA